MERGTWGGRTHLRTREDGQGRRDEGVRAGSAEPRPWRASDEESGRERKGGTSSPQRNTARRCAASAVTRTATTTALRAGRGSDGGDGEAESDELGEGHEFSADFGASWAVASLEIRTVGLGRSTVASWRVGPVDSGGGGRWARWRWATGPPRARGTELARSWAAADARWAGAGLAQSEGARRGAGPRELAQAQERGKGAGPSRGEKKRRRGWGGLAEWAREGGKLISFLFSFFFSIISV
jgi:hypothetical protein